VAAVSFPYRLPGAEVFRQVAPGNSGSVAVDHPFEDLAGVPERATPPAVTGRQEGFDERPLVIGELLVALGGGHEPSMTGHGHHLKRHALASAPSVPKWHRLGFSSWTVPPTSKIRVLPGQSNIRKR